MDEKTDAATDASQDEVAEKTEQNTEEISGAVEQAGVNLEKSADVAGEVADEAARAAGDVADEAAAEVADEAAEVAEAAGDEAAEADEAAEYLGAATDEVTESLSDAAENPQEEIIEVAGEATPAPSAPEAPAPAAPAPAPSKSKPKGKGIGDLVAVGVLSIILGVLLALPSALGLLGGGSGSSSSSGAVAVTVNGVAVSEDDVTAYVQKFRAQQGLEDDAAWGEWLVGYGYTPEALRSDTIEYYINRELIKQAIAEEGVQVEESAVDDYLNQVKEQVGGEEAFNEALAAEGLDINSYREELRLSLQQQALAEKVAPASAAVDDAEVIEVVKMYFPDAIDEKAKTLDGVDPEIVQQVRDMLTSSAAQEAFTTWMEEYRAKATIEVSDPPANLPYAVDLSAYQKAEDGASAASADAESAETPEIEVEEASGSSAAA